MTSATPKPRAGDQWLDEVVVVTGETPRTDALFRTNNEWLEFARQLERELAAATKDIKLWAANWEAMKSERDLLREREGEVGKLLKAFCECVETLAFRMEAPNAFTPQFVQLAQSFRAALTKHGR